jgi:hypothetical protein
MRQRTAVMDRAIVLDGQQIDRALLAPIEQGLDAERLRPADGPFEVSKSDLAREVARRFGDGAQCQEWLRRHL